MRYVSQVAGVSAPRHMLATLLLSFVASNLAAADPTLLNANAVDATFEQNIRFTARVSIDGTSSGWAIESFPVNQPDGTLDQSVVWPLVSPISMPVRGRSLLLTCTLSCTSAEATKHTLGHFRLSYIAAHERRAGLTAGPILSYSLGLVVIALVVGFILLIGLSFAADYLQRLD